MIDRKYREASTASGCSSTTSISPSSAGGFRARSAFADNMARGFRKAARRSTVEDMRQGSAFGNWRRPTANLVNDLSSYRREGLKIDARDRRDLFRTLRISRRLLNAGVETRCCCRAWGSTAICRDARITFGSKSMECRGASEDDTRFGAMLLGPRISRLIADPGMLDGLLRIHGEFIVSQSFAIQDRAPVLAQVAKVERQIAASDEKGTEVERRSRSRVTNWSPDARCSASTI